MGKKRLTAYKEVALDTNIFIYYFHNHPEFGPKTREIFLALMAGDLRATTSIITLIELLSKKAPGLRIKELHEELLTTPNLTIFPVESKVALEAAKIRRKYGFRVPDSIQLATAIFAKSNAFITNDERLRGFKRLPIILLKSI